MPNVSETCVRARIDRATKKRAEKVLDEIGLSVSDAIRLLMRRVARDQCFPLELKIPNAETRAAMAELDAGGGKSFNSVDELMADLRASLHEDD